MFQQVPFARKIPDSLTSEKAQEKGKKKKGGGDFLQIIFFYDKQVLLQLDIFIFF